MDTLRSYFNRSTKTDQDYRPILEETGEDGDTLQVPAPVISDPSLKAHEGPFSWFEFSIFLLLGVAMLWAW